MSSKFKKQRTAEASDSKGFFSIASANRGLILLGVLLLVTFGWAAVYNRKSLPIISTAMPTGTPPAMPANVPTRGCQEFCVIQKTGGELHNGDTERDIG